eukprot:GHVQ01005411.1.p1 GENE.GHVQ01005411.1~~GHVQ01005411.1.p1  ORF type:complete len:109 (-),score=27.53 GHVQ01005411.1:340-666(-)
MLSLLSCDTHTVGCHQLTHKLVMTALRSQSKLPVGRSPSASCRPVSRCCRFHRNPYTANPCLQETVAASTRQAPAHPPSLNALVSLSPLPPPCHSHTHTHTDTHTHGN